jgi:hypothetical protein
MERADLRRWVAEREDGQGGIETKKSGIRPLVRSILAASGIFGGIAALFIGLVCVVAHGVLPHDAVFDRVGSVLLICAIPLMLAGSLFLDEVGTKLDD